MGRPRVGRRVHPRAADDVLRDDRVGHDRPGRQCAPGRWARRIELSLVEVRLRTSRTPVLPGLWWALEDSNLRPQPCESWPGVQQTCGKPALTCDFFDR